MKLLVEILYSGRDNYAYRVQYSVFEMCVKSENIKELLEERIRKIVDPKEDSVIIYEFAIDDWAKKVKIGIPTEQEKQNDAGFLMI